MVVAQTLYTSTMEHIKEFGTVKAIGGGNLDIYRILGEQALDRRGRRLPARRRSCRYAMRPVDREDRPEAASSRRAFAAIVFAGTSLMCLGAAMISFRKVASIDPALVFRG